MKVTELFKGVDGETSSRIGLFVDGSYLRKAWKSVSAQPLSYDALCPLVEQQCSGRISVAYWFDGQYDHPRQHDRYRAAVLRAGFRAHCNHRIVEEPVRDRDGVVLRDPKTGAAFKTMRQKGVDVDLALTVERTHRSGTWTHLALVAGDADFAGLVADLVEQQQVLCTLIGTEQSVSLALRPYVTHWIDLATVKDALALEGTKAS